MPELVELNITPEQASDDKVILDILKASRRQKIAHFIKVKQSIDARRKPVNIRLLVNVYAEGETFENPIWKPDFPKLIPGKTAVIIGFGPAGMFAAIQLLERGIQPIIIERGKPVKARRRDLAVLNKEGEVNADSNYCFGEGGAGTYSDGKLYTRSKKRGDIRKVLEIFVAHGADPRILYEAHPHIGTNKLPAIVEAMRETIIIHGGIVHFEQRLSDILLKNDTVVGVKTLAGLEIASNHIILATGHSARDIFELLNAKGIQIEAKPFALGVRIEHPQLVIDQQQYHCTVKDPFLPPASYSMVEQVAGRGVFSFCMCPGGIIAPAATANGEIVVNGWSPSKRNGKFANSGLVVAVNETDWKTFEAAGPLAAMKFQEMVEQTAFQVINQKLTAPAQRLLDFLNKRNSSSLPECSYIPGVKAHNLEEVLPKAISTSLRAGLWQMGKKMKSYLSSEAILVGVESRTSSPVKIPRDRETMQHPQIQGLFPCGEGAGYAGGIMSAAMDGMAVADKI
jgi:hypothetical protein